MPEQRAASCKTAVGCTRDGIVAGLLLPSLAALCQGDAYQAATALVSLVVHQSDGVVGSGWSVTAGILTDWADKRPVHVDAGLDMALFMLCVLRLVGDNETWLLIQHSTSAQCSSTGQRA